MGQAAVYVEKESEARDETKVLRDERDSHPRFRGRWVADEKSIHDHVGAILTFDALLLPSLHYSTSHRCSSAQGM